MTDSMIRYVGLDVHKRVVEACIVDQAGKVVHRERFVLNRYVLGLFATKVLRPGDHVALEATTNCWAVADLLRPHVARVLVSNPLTTKAIAQAKVKTDKVDAYVLAQLLRCDFLPEVWQPDEATRRLRELTGRRATLVGHRTAMRNRIHSVLAMRLVEAPERLFTTAGLQWLDGVELDAQGRALVDSDSPVTPAAHAASVRWARCARWKVCRPRSPFRLVNSARCAAPGARRSSPRSPSRNGCPDVPARNVQRTESMTRRLLRLPLQRRARPA